MAKRRRSVSSDAAEREQNRLNRRQKRKLRQERAAAKKQKAKVRKKTNPKKQLILIAVIVVIAALLFSTVYGLIKLKVEAAQEEAKVQELEQQKADLEQELEMVNDPAYVEQEARDQLHMIKDGEVLYLVENSTGAPAEEPEGEAAPEEGQAPADGEAPAPADTEEQAR